MPPSMAWTHGLDHKVSKCSSSAITVGHDGDDENLPSDGCWLVALPYSGSNFHDVKLHWQSCWSTEGREGDETLASGCSGGASAGWDRKALGIGT